MFWLGPKTLSSGSSFALMFPPRGFSYRCRRLLIRCEGPAPLRRRARRRAPRVSRTSFRAIAGGRCHLYLNHLFIAHGRHDKKVLVTQRLFSSRNLICLGPDGGARPVTPQISGLCLFVLRPVESARCL